MRVLMFSLDPKLADPQSSVRARHREYATLMEELSIVVLASTEREERIVEGNLIVYTPGKRSKRAIKTWGEFLASAIADDYRKKGDTVVSSPDPFFVGYMAWKIARRFHLPLQLQLHTDIFAPGFWRASWSNKMRYFLARFLLPRAQGIRVVSERMKKLLTTRYKLQAEPVVLPVFVDTDHFRTAVPVFDLKQQYPQFEKIVLVVSRLAPEKRVDRAIEIFAKLHKQFPKAGLIIVGNGPEIEALKLQATSYKLQAVVIFAGWQNDLVPYYKGADVLLVTSDYEGYGMQIIEALASGCPVVSTDVGIAREAGAEVVVTEAEPCLALERLLQEQQRGSLSASFQLSKAAYMQRLQASFTSCVR